MGAFGTRKLDSDKKTLDMFQNLCRIQCTAEEIAGVFEISESTLRRWVKENYNQPFDKVYKIYASGGRASLRRHQFSQAERNPVMAIWLGKQFLGQRDTVDAHIIAGADEDDPLTKAIKDAVKLNKSAKRGKKAITPDLSDDEDDDEDEE